MSDHIKNKSDQHQVTHTFSNDHHFYEVKSSSGKKYNNSIKVSCDCQYMAVQGIPNSKMCSHILATLKSIVKSSDINIEEKDKDGN